MIPQSLFFGLVIPLVLLLVATLVKIFALLKENTLLAEQLTETSISFDRTKTSLEQLQKQHEEMVAFHKELQEAAVNTRPPVTKGMDFQQVERKWSAPERYGFIHTLASKGMSVEEIATILKVSPHEARQVLHLTKIGQGNEADNEMERL
jgi:hypothetical protein